MQQQGGRVPQKELDYIPLALARVKQLIDQCMEVLEPYYEDEDMELTHAQEMLIEDNTDLVDNWMTKIAKRNKSLARNHPEYKHSHIYRLAHKAHDEYKDLYATLYEGYTLHDRASGVEDDLRKFHDFLASIVSRRSVNALNSPI